MSGLALAVPLGAASLLPALFLNSLFFNRLLSQAPNVAKVSHGLSRRHISPKTADRSCTPTQNTTNIVTGAMEAPAPSGENSEAHSTAPNNSKPAALIKAARTSPSQLASPSQLGAMLLPSASLSSLLTGHMSPSSTKEAISAATALIEKTQNGRGRSDLLPMPWANMNAKSSVDFAISRPTRKSAHAWLRTRLPKCQPDQRQTQNGQE